MRCMYVNIIHWLSYDILDLGVKGTSEDYVNICQLDGWKVARITPLEDWNIKQQIDLDLHKKILEMQLWLYDVERATVRTEHKMGSGSEGWLGRCRMSFA